MTSPVRKVVNMERRNFKVILNISLDEANESYISQKDGGFVENLESYIRQELSGWAGDSFDSFKIKDLKEVYLPEDQLPPVKDMIDWVLSLDIAVIKSLFQELFGGDSNSVDFCKKNIALVQALTEKYSYFRLGLEDPSTYVYWRAILYRYDFDAKGIVVDEKEK